MLNEKSKNLCEKKYKKFFYIIDIEKFILISERKNKNNNFEKKIKNIKSLKLSEQHN